MKLSLSLIIACVLAGGIAAQSGRIKPSETPTPNPNLRPSVIYIPAREKPTLSKPGPSPTPILDDDDVIKVDSTLVPIPVSVLDANGRMVSNLKLEDFELRIDGKTQVISDLARSETPIRLAMLFDNSSSVEIAREFEKNAAIKFFRRVIRPEQDLAALFSVAITTRLEQPFTKDISSLVRSIESFPPPFGATALLDGIISAADYLRDIQGRRVIVIVSDGDDTASDSSLEVALKALQTANCQVFVVKTTDFENYVRTKSRAGNANIRQLTAERRMIEISGQTGGAVYSPVDEKELDEAFRQISSELSQQYILSYYPETETEKRGEFRAISLAVKNRQNADVRTRKGYYVPKK